MVHAAKYSMIPMWITICLPLCDLRREVNVGTGVGSGTLLASYAGRSMPSPWDDPWHVKGRA